MINSKGDVVKSQYTAAIKIDGDWWIGWIEEIPGVNCQEKTKDELLESLRVTLKEALDLNKRSAVPRHSEISDILSDKICKDLGIPPVTKGKT